MKTFSQKFLKDSFFSLKTQFLSFAKKNPYLLAFCLFVPLVHISFLIYANYRKISKKPPRIQKLAVKTYSLPESLSKEKSSLKTVSISEKPIANTASKPSTEKKFQAKTVSKKKEVSKLKTDPSKKVSNERKKLIQDLQESIAKIESNRDNISSTASVLVPKPIKELKADAYEIQAEVEEESNAPISYANQLVLHLKTTLSLPAFGSVKVRLTLSNVGKIENLEIIASDSEVNRLYLEKNLQELSYPIFTEELASKKNHTFLLTFCSD